MSHQFSVFDINCIILYLQMQQMLNSPIMESLLSNPEMMQNMMLSNPQLQPMLDANPQIRHILNDPAVLSLHHARIL